MNESQTNDMYCLLRTAMVCRLYNVHAKHTSNTGFDRTFMPFFYSLPHNECDTHYRGLTYSVKQTVRESVGLPLERGKLVCEFNFHKVDVNLHCRLYTQLTVGIIVVRKKLTIKRTQVKVLDWQRVGANFTSVNVHL